MKFLTKIKREYLDLPANTRNGIVVLTILLFLSVISVFLFKNFFTEPVKPLSAIEIASLDSAIKVLEKTPEEDSVIITKFDPNFMDSISWEQRGIPLWLGVRINNYLRKGGHFDKPEDLLKIYGFTQEYYNKIAPYIFIKAKEEKVFTKESTSKSFSVAEKKYVRPEKLIVELNTADTLQLEKLPGIGLIMASRIVKYRSLLGGFVYVGQLSEVYGMKPEVLAKINNEVKADSLKIRKIDLTTVDPDILYRHPYIGSKKAKLILKLRKYENNINTGTLLENNVFTTAELEKIRPYLKLDHSQ